MRPYREINNEQWARLSPELKREFRAERMNFLINNPKEGIASLPSRSIERFADEARKKGDLKHWVIFHHMARNKLAWELTGCGRVERAILTERR